MLSNLVTALVTKAKAVIAFLAAEGAFLSTHGLSAAGHWVTHVAALVTAVVVYLVPNAKADVEL